MSDDAQRDPIPTLLTRVGWGDERAEEKLSAALYDELRRVAGVQMRRERGDHTLCATALVNEAYLKLLSPVDPSPGSRTQFLGRAAHAMRQVLVDHARRRGARKRGGEASEETLGDAVVTHDGSQFEILDLHQALERLDGIDARKSRIAELVLFGGLTLGEVADTIGCGIATAKREWGLAKAWLGAQLGA